MGRMLGVLEVRRGNDHFVNILGILIKVDVARVRINLVANLFLDLRLGILVETLLPEVGNGNQIEVEFLVMMQEAGQERSAKTVGIAYARNAHTLVRAKHIEGRTGKRRRTGELCEISAFDFGSLF